MSARRAERFAQRNSGAWHCQAETTIAETDVEEATCRPSHPENEPFPGFLQVPPVLCDGSSDVEGHRPNEPDDPATRAEHLLVDLANAPALAFGSFHPTAPFMHQPERKQAQRRNGFVLRAQLLGNGLRLALERTAPEVALLASRSCRFSSVSGESCYSLHLLSGDEPVKAQPCTGPIWTGFRRSRWYG